MLWNKCNSILKYTFNCMTTEIFEASSTLCLQQENKMCNYVSQYENEDVRCTPAVSRSKAISFLDQRVKSYEVETNNVIHCFGSSHWICHCYMSTLYLITQLAIGYIRRGGEAWSKLHRYVEFFPLQSHRPEKIALKDVQKCSVYNHKILEMENCFTVRLLCEGRLDSNVIPCSQ